MKTTIGVVSKGEEEIVTNIATEFFGVKAAAPKTKKAGVLWLTFPSKTFAKSFADAIHYRCVDIEKKDF